jgi:integrase
MATRSASVSKQKRANGEGSVYPKILKSGKKVYIAAAKDINGKICRKTCYKVSEAYDHLYKMKQDRLLGKNTFAVNPKMTVTEFLESWLSNRANLKPETRRNYQGAITNRIAPVIGKLKVATITPATIENLYQKLDAQGYKAGTLNVTHAVLSSAFADSFRLNLLPHNPMSKVKKVTKRSTPTKHIPQADAERIYAYATKDPYTHARIELGIFMGLRPGEVFGLKWDDISYSAKTITIERQVQRVKGVGLVFQSVKTGDIRTIPLSDDQVTILQRHQVTQMALASSVASADNLVFPNSRGNKMDPKRDHKSWKELLAAAGVKTSYTRYQMRKTAFTTLATSGVDFRTIMEISGHKQVSTLINSYVHPTTESMRAALDIQDQRRSQTPSIEAAERKKALLEAAEKLGARVLEDISPEILRERMI